MCKHLQRFRMANDTLFSLLNIHLIWMMRMVDSKKEANKSCNDNLFHSRKDKVNFWHGLKYLLNKTSVTYRLVTIYTKCQTTSINYHLYKMIRYNIFNNIFFCNQDHFHLFLQDKPTFFPLLLFSDISYKRHCYVWLPFFTVTTN